MTGVWGRTKEIVRAFCANIPLLAKAFDTMGAPAWCGQHQHSIIFAVLGEIANCVGVARTGSLGTRMSSPSALPLPAATFEPVAATADYLSCKRRHHIIPSQ